MTWMGSRKMFRVKNLFFWSTWPSPNCHTDIWNSQCCCRRPAGVVEQTHAVQMPGELAESLNCTHGRTSQTHHPDELQPAERSRHGMCLLHLQRLPFNSAKLWGGFESGEEGFYLGIFSNCRTNPDCPIQAVFTYPQKRQRRCEFAEILLKV